MKKIILIILALIPFLGFSQMEAGEYINADTVKKGGIDVYVDHLQNIESEDMGKFAKVSGDSVVWSEVAIDTITQNAADIVTIKDQQASQSDSILNNTEAIEAIETSTVQPATNLEANTGVRDDVYISPENLYFVLELREYLSERDSLTLFLTKYDGDTLTNSLYDSLVVQLALINANVDSIAENNTRIFSLFDSLANIYTETEIDYLLSIINEKDINQSDSLVLALDSLSNFLLLSDFGDILATHYLTELDSTGFEITESQISDLVHFTNEDETDQIYSADSADIVHFNELEYFTNEDETDKVYAGDSTKIKADIIENTDSILANAEAIENIVIELPDKASFITALLLLNDTDYLTAKNIGDLLDLYIQKDEFNATLTGDIDGVNTTFTTDKDFVPNTTQLFWNGQTYKRGLHYEEVGVNTIEFYSAFTPQLDDYYKLNYKY